MPRVPGEDSYPNREAILAANSKIKDIILKWKGNYLGYFSVLINRLKPLVSKPRLMLDGVLAYLVSMLARGGGVDQIGQMDKIKKQDI